MPFDDEISSELSLRGEEQATSMREGSKPSTCLFPHSSPVILISSWSRVKIMETDCLCSYPGTVAS